jgi:predicted phage terminase large subunit-like protein
MPGDVLHPERESGKNLEILRSGMGSVNFSAQYLQAPVPADGLLVKAEWLKRWKIQPRKADGGQIVQSWDTASKDGVMNDWSVCVTALVRQNTVHVLDVFRKRLTFPELLAKVGEQALRFKANAILIEDAASGQQLLQMLRANPVAGVPMPIGRKVTADKVTRMSAQSSRIEAGDLVLPEDAHWLGSFESELLSFPSTPHDDQVDALAQLLEWTGNRSAASEVLVGGRLVEGSQGYDVYGD